MTNKISDSEEKGDSNLELGKKKESLGGFQKEGSKVWARQRRTLRVESWRAVAELGEECVLGEQPDSWDFYCGPCDPGTVEDYGEEPRMFH